MNQEAINSAKWESFMKVIEVIRPFDVAGKFEAIYNAIDQINEDTENFLEKMGIVAS
jgi:hypothetical protein